MDNLKTCEFPYISIYSIWIHDESRGFPWIHVMWFVTRYLENLEKPWKALENLGTIQIFTGFHDLLCGFPCGFFTEKKFLMYIYLLKLFYHLIIKIIY